MSKLVVVAAPVAVAVVVTMFLLGGALAIFLNVALDLRPDVDFDEFVRSAKLVFVAIYAVAVATSAGVAYALGRRRGVGAPAAGIAAAVVVLVLVLTLPIVDFFNACYVGVGFFGEAGC